MLSDEELHGALRIFRLEHLPRARWAEFTSLLRKRYHRLARQVHPDVKGGSSDAFARLHNLYLQLLEVYESHPNRLRQLLPQTPLKTLSDNSGQQFQYYKQTSLQINQAFNDYFAQVKQVDLTSTNAAYIDLKVKLSSLKDELQRLVQSNPRAIWVDDCRQQLRKIDIWLREP